jgi:hypothetical protein
MRDKDGDADDEERSDEYKESVERDWATSNEQM